MGRRRASAKAANANASRKRDPKTRLNTDLPFLVRPSLSLKKPKIDELPQNVSSVKSNAVSVSDTGPRQSLGPNLRKGDKNAYPRISESLRKNDDNSTPDSKIDPTPTPKYFRSDAAINRIYESGTLQGTKGLLKANTTISPQENHLLKVKMPSLGNKDNDGEDVELRLRMDTSTDNSLQNALKVALGVREGKSEIQKELMEFITEGRVWEEFCHHVYLQHQTSLQSLRDLDLSLNSSQVHEAAKEVYREHLETSGGSMLELMLATLKFGFNAILIQYMAEQKDFHVFSINPQNEEKCVFLNVGSPSNGKWRYLEYDQNLQTGVYGLESTVPEKTVLTIKRKEGAPWKSMKKIPECNLQLFNRLLSRAARLEEFTFTLGSSHKDIIPPSSGDAAKEIAGQSEETEREPNQSAEFLLQPRPSPPPSTYAFKSLETLEDCEGWCRNLTKTPGPKVSGTNLEVSDPLCQKQFPKSLGTEAALGMLGFNLPRRETPTQPLLPGLTTRTLEFQPLVEGKVSVATLQDEEFGSPQILLRFQPGAKLTQEAAHELFVRPLHSSLQLSILHQMSSQFSIPKPCTGELRIPQGSTFSLCNSGSYPASIRCAWFTGGAP